MYTYIYIYTYICIYIYIYIHTYIYKFATVVEDYTESPVSIATTPKCRRGCDSFPWIATLYP